MRILLAIVVAAALAWSGWWLLNARLREGAIEDWLAERRADGWVAEAAGVEVRGFPNRLDLIVEDLALADPASEWSWTAPEFQVLSLTWTPHHVISVWPGEQVFATPHETVRVASDRLRGSVVFVPSPGLALDRSAIEIAGMRLAGETGWQAALDEAMLAVRRAAAPDAPEHAYDLSFEADGLALPEELTAGLGRSGVLPARMEAAALDATLDFDRPWDRAAVEGANPALEAVAVRDLRVSWGKLDLRARGAVDVGADGLAEGRLDLRVRNWREMLALAADAGLIGEGAARTAETALGLLARLSADSSSIEVPLVFEDGQARIGPVPVGPAPRLARR